MNLDLENMDIQTAPFNYSAIFGIVGNLARSSSCYCLVSKEIVNWLVMLLLLRSVHYGGGKPTSATLGGETFNSRLEIAQSLQL